MANFVTTKSSNHRNKDYYRKKAKENWDRWRLLVNDMSHFTYSEVFLQMTDEEVMEANGALDIAIEELKKQQAKIKKR